MNNINVKKRVFLIIAAWGLLSVIVIIVAIVSNNTKSPSVTHMDEDGDINISLLSPKEREAIQSAAKEVLTAFLNQNADEPAEARGKRLAGFLSSDSLVNNLPLEVMNTYSSRYALIEKITAKAADFVNWSEVTETKVIVYTTMHITYLDAEGFEDRGQSNYFVIFKKETGRWLVYNLEKWAYLSQ
jgi:hypothetical protein